MKKARTGFVFDPSTMYTIDEEAEEAERVFANLGIELNQVAKCEHMMELPGKRLDLLILDFGAVAARGNSASANVQIYAACQYAEDHPGTLVVLWSKYTARVYEDELEDEFGHLTNVLLRFVGDESAYDFSGKGRQRFVKMVEAWFSGFE